MTFEINYEKLEEVYRDLQGQSFWKPSEGENIIRIMPAYNEAGDWFKEVFFHYEVGPVKANFPCRRSFGQDCYICNIAEAVRPSNPDLTRKLYRRRRFFMNIVDMNQPGKGVQVYACGPMVARDIFSYVRDRKRYGLVLDPDNGRNIVIERMGQGRDSRYIVKIDPESTPIANRKWLDNLYNLDEIVRPPLEEDVRASLPDSYIKNPDILISSSPSKGLPPSRSSKPTEDISTESISRQLESLLGGEE